MLKQPAGPPQQRKEESKLARPPLPRPNANYEVENELTLNLSRISEVQGFPGDGLDMTLEDPFN